MKKASISLSVRSVVTLVIVLVVLVLLLGFITVYFGGSSEKIEEFVASEAEPPIPAANYPIELSRENVIAKAGTTEVIRISVFNPTNQNWTFRDYYSEDVPCALDGICDLLDCESDPDCDGPGSCAGGDVCVKDFGCEEVGMDSDCGPTEGVRLVINCDNELDLKIETNPKTILVNDFDTFTALLNIKGGVSSGTYLCNVKIEAEASPDYTKDLIVEVA